VAAVLAEGRIAELGDLVAEQADRPRVGPVQVQDRPRKGRLPTAALADQRRRARPAEREADSVDCRDDAPAAAEAAAADERLAQLIDREERIRAYWMTEILDGASTIGAAWNLGISPPEGTAILPCSDSIWAFPQHIINVWSFGDFHFSSAFSLCIILVASELWHVHRFLQKAFDTRVHEQRLRWQQESQQIDERLTAWRGEFVAAVYRLINAEYAQEERAEFDPNIVLTNCILDTAVIALFQRLAPSPNGIENFYEAWPYATNRCLYACDDMTAKIRLVRDKELENSSPHLIFSMFVAARFYLGE